MRLRLPVKRQTLKTFGSLILVPAAIEFHERRSEKLRSFTSVCRPNHLVGFWLGLVVTTTSHRAALAAESSLIDDPNDFQKTDCHKRSANMRFRPIKSYFHLLLGVAAFFVAHASTNAHAQLGGGGGGLGGGGGPGGGLGGAQAPPAAAKPKFRDHIHSLDGLPSRRESGDKIIADVRVVGNKYISTNHIIQQILTRKGRFYDYETVLGDVRRLNDLGSFDRVSFKTQDTNNGTIVSFIVSERPIIQGVVYHGNRALNDRELAGRAGVAPHDPLSEFSIETSRRRVLDYYHEEGFNQASVLTQIGTKTEPGLVVFRINEGQKERIHKINIVGSTILSEGRLKNVIKSRGSILGVVSYVNNKADMAKINEDVKILESMYHNLGYLTATVGRRLSYDESGKWIDLTFVVREGPRFTINSIQFVGNRFVTSESIQAKLAIKPGDTFHGTKLRVDVGEIIYGYGELGFIYAEVDPQTIIRDDANSVDLVFKIEEGDRWKIGEILVNIEGEPHLMRETTLLNMLNMREGDYINRAALETGKNVLQRSQLLESNPQVADPPDIKVVPRDGS